MTQEDRIRAVRDCGFAERQARFLVLVMRHTGVCLPRQYASVAGIANGGRRCNACFDKLVKRGYAHEIRCVHNRARVYHVHHKPLYLLIGEASNRYRRPLSPRVAVERLMLLDAVLAVGDVDWLTTAAEKTAYFERLKADATIDPSQPPSGDDASPSVWPCAAVPPIGVASDGRLVLLFLASEPTTDGFRRFLQTHAGLLRVAPRWMISIVFPRPLDHAYHAYQTVIHEELESPWHSATIGELQSHFALRLAAARGEPMDGLNQGLLRKGHERFAAARFTAMYHRWLKQRDASSRFALTASRLGMHPPLRPLRSLARESRRMPARSRSYGNWPCQSPHSVSGRRRSHGRRAISATEDVRRGGTPCHKRDVDRTACATFSNG